MERDRDFIEFPGLMRTLAIGLVLAGMVGGLYLFAANHHSTGQTVLASRGAPGEVTLVRMTPSGSSGS